MSRPASHTVTFLFTDIEGSTALWEAHPERMSDVIARHDALLARTVVEAGGHVFKTVGDAVFAAFGRTVDAVAAALAAQREIAAIPWAVGPLRVRMAIHAGTAELREGDYFGSTLNRVSRILGAGHGGQVLLSLTARELARGGLPPGSEMRDLSERARGAAAAAPVRLLTHHGPRGCGQDAACAAGRRRACGTSFSPNACFSSWHPVSRRSSRRCARSSFGPTTCPCSRSSSRIRATSRSRPTSAVRARAVKPAFELTAANVEQVTGICRLVDGLPLAIELAAARIRVLSPQALLGRLGARLDLLSGGARDLPERHQTLRDTIAWSFDLLAPRERTAFRRLAVFAGGCSLESAEAVCQDAALLPEGEVLDALEALVDESLLRHEETVSGEGRFSMLHTIREYALGALAESGEEAVTFSRFEAHFVELAEEGGAAFRGEGQSRWLMLLNAEHDNLRSVLARADARSDHGTLARVGGAIWYYWWVQGHLREGREWLERALAGALTPALRLKALNGAGGLAWQQSDYEVAKARYDETQRLARELGDEGALASALSNLGITHLRAGEASLARSLFEESRALSQKCGNDRDMAYALGNLGELDLFEERYEEARERLEESLELHRRTGDRHSEAITLNNLGEAWRHLGRLDGAAELYARSLALFRELEAKHGVAFALGNLGDLERSAGHGVRARELYREAITLFAELGNRREIGRILAGLAVIESIEGRHDLTARLLGAAEALSVKLMLSDSSEDREAYARARAQSIESIGEERFRRLHADGGAVDLERAAALALGDEHAAAD
ncbi:MAG: tetratricopeptide repeat protein [Gemmatimonadetes bacterium]|nr:tetratricopeptide repeat protein [Gemmatimonadota bacterium]